MIARSNQWNPFKEEDLQFLSALYNDLTYQSELCGESIAPQSEDRFESYKGVLISVKTVWDFSLQRKKRSVYMLTN